MTRHGKSPSPSKGDAGSAGKWPCEHYVREFLRELGSDASKTWCEAAECMAGEVAQAMKQEREQNNRKIALEKLNDISRLSKLLIELTQRDDVRESLRVWAPPPDLHPDDLTGYHYIASLASRAKQAAEHITTASGGRMLRPINGSPKARQLCATMVREAWKVVHGKHPGEANAGAQNACEALWMAAGGADAGPDDAGGRWVRPLREAAEENAAALYAQMSAHACMSILQQETPKKSLFP